MAQEIERKFMVLGSEFKAEASKAYRIIQGYLSSVPERTVRVRVKGDKGYLTIKGPVGESGISRYEWEKEILADEAIELLKLCEPGVIEKMRYEVVSGHHIFEIDEFLGENLGLVVAEIELSSEEETFVTPPWIGKEVTGEIRYYNSSLIKIPFAKWQEQNA